MIFELYLFHILQKLTCIKMGMCSIDFATRKCCPKCRLEKCLSVGMGNKMLLQKANNDLRSENDATENSQILSQNLQFFEKYLNEYIEENVQSVEQVFNSELTFNQCDKYPKRSYATALTAHEWKLIREIRSAMEVFEDERTLPIIGQY